MQDIKWEPFPRHIVKAVDYLIEQRQKSKTISYTVDVKSDWKIVHHLYSMWKHYYPHEYKKFIQGQKQRRVFAKDKFATGKDKGGAEIRHTVEVPQRFYRLLRAFFPHQKLTKKFSHKLAKEIPDLQVPEKI